MRKIMPYIFIVLGVIAIAFGSIRTFTNNQEEKNAKEENENKEGDEENNTQVTNDVKNEIEKYLNEKYNEEFEVVELTKTFCLEYSETNLYPSEPCNDKKIKNQIYKVKDSNNINFYVKKVSYDESKITLSREEDKNSQSIGLYDTYISFYMMDKLNDELETEYKTTFGSEVEVEIYKGLGIENLKYSNAYSSLGKDTQDLKDKTMPLQGFASNFSGFDNDLGIHIKLDMDITKDNFQDIVKKIKENDFLNGRNYLDIDTIILSFNNDNRYIEYNYESFLELKFGKDIYDSFNDNLYDKTVVMGSGFSSNGINYTEFMSLDKNSFNF